MQYASQMLFCDECGLANDLVTNYCASCQHLLLCTNSTLATPPVIPVSIAPLPMLEVTSGSLFSIDNQSESTPPKQHPTCDFQPGSILNERYQIKKKIGCGGFSLVYHAVDLDMNYREVAIKRIPFNALTPHQILEVTETFNREITMLARFKSVNGVPKLYEHLTDTENWYLIMQYIPGQTLEEYLQEAPHGYLSEEEVIELGITLAHILQDLHKVNPPVIFRDVKPANVMITPQHELFLIDFGIARNYTPGKKKDTMPLGSPGYAPPEQYGHNQTNNRADIYSLGATLQTLLTGRDPLELKIGECSRNPQLPSRSLRKLLDQMLSPTPTERPSDMRHIRKRLEDAQHLPTASYVMGLVIGSTLSVLIAVALLTNFEHFINGAIDSLFMLGMIPSSHGVKKKFKIKSTKWFYWSYLLFGILTGLLLLLIMWQWFLMR